MHINACYFMSGPEDSCAFVTHAGNTAMATNCSNQDIATPLFPRDPLCFGKET